METNGFHIIIGTLIYQTAEYCFEFMKVLLLSVKFLVVSPLLLLPLSPALLLPWLNIWMQHPLMITQNTAMTHNQPAKNAQRQNTRNLWFPAPRRGIFTIAAIFFYSLSPSHSHYWTVFMPFLSCSSRALISSSLPLLDVCAVWQKTHFLSTLQSFHLCLIPSFLVVCHSEITETGTINRRLRRTCWFFLNPPSKMFIVIRLLIIKHYWALSSPRRIMYSHICLSQSHPPVPLYKTPLTGFFFSSF